MTAVWERWVALSELIETEPIRNGVSKVLSEFKDDLELLPSSKSRRYHKHEPLLIDHTENCVNFAGLIVELFKLEQLDKDIFLAGVILHDIGKCKTCYLHDTGSKHVKFMGDYWVDRRYSHELWSGMIVRSANFMHCDKIAELVESHMGRFSKRSPQPKTFLQQMVAICDYLATKVVSYELEEKKQWNSL